MSWEGRHSISAMRTHPLVGKMDYVFALGHVRGIS
jgi:hypothetical protein